MATGHDLIMRAKTKIGCKYSLGVITPKDNPDSCLFDCAEFASWVVYQETNRLYGCANNEGNPHTQDAYSGFWARDVEKLGHEISVAEARGIEGAVILRIAGSGLIGHVVFSTGDGRTVEAHSTKRGVIQNVVDGRRWDKAALIPWVDYTIGDVDSHYEPPTEKIYHYTNPLMHDDFIKKIQVLLHIPSDGIYGMQTFNAVKAFQAKKGLVADGEAGPKTLRMLGLA